MAPLAQPLPGISASSVVNLVGVIPLFDDLAQVVRERLVALHISRLEVRRQAFGESPPS